VTVGGEAGEAPHLTVAAVARRLGVAPPTLRTWDRRYGLGPSAHAEGTRRRYSPTDLSRLQLMRRLVLEGVAPAEAAAAALRATRAPDSGVPGTAPLPPAPPAPAPPAPAPPAPASGPWGPDPAAGRPAAHGGRVLALPGAGPAVRGLARAALALDGAAVRAQVVAHVRSHGVHSAWDDLLRPVLRALGDRWATTGEGVESEHLVSDTAVLALREAVPAPVAPRGRPVLLTSAEDEQHALPLHVLAAALAEVDVVALVLGAALPAAALRAAVLRTGPGAVLVWSQLPATAVAGSVDGLPVTRPATVLFVAGPGWSGREPSRARVLADLPTAVSELRAAVGA